MPRTGNEKKQVSSMAILSQLESHDKSYNSTAMDQDVTPVTYAVILACAI